MPTQAAKEPTIHVTGYTGAPWPLWNLLYGLPYVEIRRMSGTRYLTVELKLCGVQLAVRSDSITRGKVAAHGFVFTSEGVKRG